MGVVQFDIQKIEQLLNSATSERQRKMYQALLNKARSQEPTSTDSSVSRTTPSTEKKTQTKEPKKQQQPDAEPTIFQAIGTVIATPYLKNDLLKVAINGCEYDLFYVPGFRRHAYTLLRAELENNGSSPMFLRLYPKAKFEPNSQQPRLFFSLVNFSRDCEKINHEPSGFVLRGIWQYISRSESPVISIYRNCCASQWEFFKKLNTHQQFYFTPARHIPVVWDAPVEPFKFNPQAEKASQMSRYFVEVRAILKDGLYLVEEMLREPTLDIPKFIKVPKKK